MNIAVIDQGPELFWYVSNALINDEVKLKHLKSKSTGFDYIFNELPEIVIINGDDAEIEAVDLIGKVRNHVFARNTQFIVSTQSNTLEARKAFMVAGAGYILYRSKSYEPSPSFFKNILTWISKIKEPPTIIQQPIVEIRLPVELTSFGRLGSIREDGVCLIETNLDLNKGESILVENAFLDELGLKKVKIKVLEKDSIGRYYQYAHSYITKVEFENNYPNSITWNEWIKFNTQVSKPKNIKLVYFENHPTTRENIRKLIKADSKYCARGYKDLNDIIEVIEYQKPQIILVNRELIDLENAQFLKLRDYLKKHQIFTFSYSEEISDPEKLEEYKKNYPTLLHAKGPIELSVLEAIIEKIIQNSPSEKQVVFGKHSPYSRINFHFHGEIIDLSSQMMTINSEVKLNPFTPLSMNSKLFTKAQIGKNQFGRVFEVKPGASKIHRVLFIAQNSSEKTAVDDVLDKIKEVGLETWKK